MPTPDVNYVAYRNTIARIMPPEDCVTATVLLKRLVYELDGFFENDMSVAYDSLLRIIDSMEVRNPFNNEAGFAATFQAFKKIEEIDWGMLLSESRITSRKSLINLPMLAMFGKRIADDIQEILVAEAEKWILGLEDIVKVNLDKRFVLSTQDIVYADVFRLIFADYDNVEVVHDNIYSPSLFARRFDVICGCPEFGGRNMTEEHNFICREYDMVALENLALHLNTGGRLRIILPARIAFADGRVKALRSFIQDNYTIKEISELPDRLFEFTAIKMYFLEIENTRPEADNDITIRRYVTQESENGNCIVSEMAVGEETFVMPDELVEQGDWNVAHIFALQEEEYLSYKNSAIKKDILGNVAEIFRGKAITKKGQLGKIGVLNISNLGEYEIDYDGLEHIDMEKRKVANYILKDGDVVLPARGTALRTAVFRAQKYTCIASSNIIVIRPDLRMLDSTYLKIFLDSPIGNKVISGAQQGTVVMNISYRDLKTIEVPVPDIEQQKRIADEYNREYETYKSTVTAAQKRWNEVQEELRQF